MPVLIRFSMPPIAFWQQSGRTCSLNIRILSLNFDYLLSLEDEIKELTTERDNPRLQLFTNGDVVRMKTDTTEYTVTGKRNNKIIAVNKDNIEQEFSPDALLTVNEYQEETETFYRDIKKLYK